MTGIIEEVLEIAKLIMTWIHEGASTEEIRDRLADPAGVAAGMLDRAVERRRRGREMLGR